MFVVTTRTDSRAFSANSVIAAWTIQAQLILYEYLQKLGSRVLYCDTDSCIYVSRGELSEPHTGNFLSDMIDELESYGVVLLNCSCPEASTSFVYRKVADTKYVQLKE